MSVRRWLEDLEAQGYTLRRPYEELHAENQRLRDQLQAALTQINALLERERRREAEADEDVA